MYFEQVYERGLAQSSYIVGCQADGTAIVVDPRRDVDIYLEIAEREELTISYVTETHIHADFLSGARELAARTGAELLLSEEGGPEWRYAFDHTPLRDGDTIAVGNVRLEVVHTPGHTPEHLSFLLYDLAAGLDPRMFFTGDFLFVGDVGRPDLLEEAAGVTGTREPGARAMWRSLSRLENYPDHLQIWPGHGAGSACGKALGAVPSSSLGYERVTNWAFRAETEDSFVGELLEGQPEAPYYFAQMKRLNKDRQESSIVAELPVVPELDPDGVIERASNGEIQVIDLRDAERYFGGHLPGSVSVPYDQGMSTWFGWVLDYERPIVLVGERWQIGPAQRALLRIGLDHLVGFLEASRVATLSVNLRSESIDVAEARDRWNAGALIVDVRGAREYQESHIDGSIHIHVGRLRRSLDVLPRDREILLHCQTGYRSAIATSVLEGAGFSRIANIHGGYEAWANEINEGIVVPVTR